MFFNIITALIIWVLQLSIRITIFFRQQVFLEVQPWISTTYVIWIWWHWFLIMYCRTLLISIIVTVLPKHKFSIILVPIFMIIIIITLWLTLIGMYASLGVYLDVRSTVTATKARFFYMCILAILIIFFNVSVHIHIYPILKTHHKIYTILWYRTHIFHIVFNSFGILILYIALSWNFSLFKEHKIENLKVDKFFNTIMLIILEISI